MPAPSTPAAPTRAKKSTDRYPNIKKETGARTVVPTRIWIVNRRSPDPGRVIRRHIDDVRVGRFYLHYGLTGFRGCDHLLLRSRLQFTVLLRLSSHPLDRGHHIGLLRQ